MPRSDFGDYYFDDYNGKQGFDDFAERWAETWGEEELFTDDFWEVEYMLTHSEEFDRSAHGELADWLELLGYRDEDWDWDVGDTPS